jgi:hypothetical protein
MVDNMNNVTYHSEAQLEAVNDFIESMRGDGAFVGVNTDDGSVVVTLIELDEDEVVIGHETHIVTRDGVLLA